MITWAGRVKALRDVGMTLAEIGEKVGLSTSAVSDVAQERIKAPGGDAALKLDALYRAKTRSSRSSRRTAA